MHISIIGFGYHGLSWDFEIPRISKAAKLWACSTNHTSHTRRQGVAGQGFLWGYFTNQLGVLKQQTSMGAPQGHMCFLPSKIIALHQINSWTLKIDTRMKVIFQPINGRVNINFGECSFYKKWLNRTWKKIKEVRWFENLGRWMGSRSFMGNISLKLDALYQLFTGFV